MSLLTRYQERFKENWPRIRLALKRFAVVAGILLLFLTAFFYNRIFISIDSGHGGVMWRRFLGGNQMKYDRWYYGGTDLKHVYGEGFHIIPPWDRLTVYDMRIQQVPHSFTALSSDGLPIQVDLSIRYRPVAAELPMLHQNVGVDYVEKIVKPEVQAMVRFVVAQYTPDQIYTSEGFLLNIIKQGVLGEILEHHILLDDLLIKRLTLPEPLRLAIEGKLIQQQQVLEYKYRLEKEEKEADRRRIEAAGIRDFQLEVMKGGAFDQYLRYEGISATLKLATSNNAKVVVTGGRDGLPVIMNVSDTSISQAPPAAPAGTVPAVGAEPSPAPEASRPPPERSTPERPTPPPAKK